MKRIALIVAALVLGLALTAWADHDTPNTCLAIRNETTYDYTIKVTTPSVYEQFTWTSRAGKSMTLAIQGQPIKSASGEWYVRWTGPYGSDLRSEFIFRPDWADSECPNGVWLLILRLYN